MSLFLWRKLNSLGNSVTARPQNLHLHPKESRVTSLILLEIITPISLLGINPLGVNAGLVGESVCGGRRKVVVGEGDPSKDWARCRCNRAVLVERIVGTRIESLERA